MEPSYSAHTKPWACTEIPNLVVVDVHLRLAGLSPLNIQNAHDLRYVQYFLFPSGIGPALTVTAKYSIRHTLCVPGDYPRPHSIPEKFRAFIKGL